MKIDETEQYNYKGTKESIEDRAERGLVRRCGCGKYWIGSEHERCGLCTGREKAKKNLGEIEKIKSEIKLKK